MHDYLYIQMHSLCNDKCMDMAITQYEVKKFCQEIKI
jgi:hypothetical protein